LRPERLVSIQHIESAGDSVVDDVVLARDTHRNAVHDLTSTPGAELGHIDQVGSDEGDVVAGTYRCKTLDGPTAEYYMGTWETDADGRPVGRGSDFAISAKLVPAGFLKITAKAVDDFMVAYPELCYGPMQHLSVDLFNHGVHNRIWWGEDYSFARRWKEKCGDIWLVPDLSIDHHATDRVYPGNLHEFLLRCPGGSKA
jgi:hypothetical protein